MTRDDQKEIKHILFRPSDVMLRISADRSDEELRIISINTVTAVRFRVATTPELVDGAAPEVVRSSDCKHLEDP